MRVMALVRVDAEMCDSCTVKPNCVSCFTKLLMQGSGKDTFDFVDVEILAIGDPFKGAK